MSSQPWLLPKLIIAEIGSVHDGSFGNAINLITLASKCGANAVKFQTHLADHESTLGAPSPSYFNLEPRNAYFKRTSFSMSQWHDLKAHAESLNCIFLSSPFSVEALDILEGIGMPIYKIPSGEVSNTPLLERIAEFGKPVILSSGMSTWDELDVAVSILKNNCPTLIMQCSSQYPCLDTNVGLNVLGEMAARYDIPVGFSDHTLGLAAPIAAASLGAIAIEKHFTFSKSMYGSDAAHSMEPDEFKLLANSLQSVWTMLQHPVDKSICDDYREMKNIFEKSIVVSKSLASGDIIDMSSIAFKKPGNGIPASKYKSIIGKTVKCDLAPDTILSAHHYY